MGVEVADRQLFEMRVDQHGAANSVGAAILDGLKVVKKDIRNG